MDLVEDTFFALADNHHQNNHEKPIMSSKEIYLKPTRMRTHPHTTRSRLMLEVASELVNRRDWPYLQARVSLRAQGEMTGR